MQRIENWPTALAAEIAARLALPFAWGSNDCCQFVAACVHAMTGESFAPRFGKYHTELGASRILSRAGGLASLVSDVLGEPISVMWARRGDIVLVREHDRSLLAIVDGERWLAPAPEGLASGYVLSAHMAWKVG
jgi:hypothetical protein